MIFLGKIFDQKYFVHGVQSEQEKTAYLMIALLHVSNMFISNISLQWFPMLEEKILKRLDMMKE
jgi:hypothetical protein